jgi:hypothetical protein
MRWGGDEGDYEQQGSERGEEESGGERLREREQEGKRGTECRIREIKAAEHGCKPPQPPIRCHRCQRQATLIAWPLPAPFPSTALPTLLLCSP